MFVIELIYKVELTEIDRHMAAHVKFLKKYYASGHFLVSSRKSRETAGSSSLSVRAGTRFRPSFSRIRFARTDSPTSASSSSAPASAPTTSTDELRRASVSELYRSAALSRLRSLIPGDSTARPSRSTLMRRLRRAAGGRGQA